jgi:beta-lactamase regulating signal transducer with metallopeptidase domain
MLWWLAQTTVTATLLAAIAATAGFVFRLRPAVRHALWLLVLLKLLTPPLVEWRVPLDDFKAYFSSALTVPARDTTYRGDSQTGPSRIPDLTNALTTSSATRPSAVRTPPQFGTNPLRGSAESAATGLTPEIAVTRYRPAIATVVTFVWMGGVAIAVLAVWVRIRRFQRLLMWRLPAPAWLTQHVNNLAQRMRVWPPTAHLLPGIRTPLIWCVGPAKLLVPETLMDQLSINARRGVIVHELAHLRRRDHWVRWLEVLAFLIWWWNPLFWLVRRQLRHYSELACDGWVVETLPACRRAYAEALIEVSSSMSQRADPVFALGMATAGRRAFERRLKMIMREGGSCRISIGGMAAIGLLALFVLPTWSPAQKDEPATPEKPAASAEPTSERMLADALTQAKCGGKYAMLLRQFRATEDAETYGDFTDYGSYTGKSYAGYDDLPPGFWVYVKPHWYIWRDQTATAKPARAWGPEQATGEPDTNEAGDRQTAWASRTQDDQDEWLLLEFAQPTMPKEVHVHATFNPGAIYKLTVFRLDGSEVEIWKGRDPTSAGSESGVSKIPVKEGLLTNRIRLYLASKEVPGWNEIDAVGLVDKDGKTQWAVAADASSTYAQPEPLANNRPMQSGKRAWGPEQAVGPPDTPEAGDFQTAWASLTQDGQDEWLKLEYGAEVSPSAVLVHANYNPGALCRITAFRPDGSEIEVWQGKDPTPAGSGKGISVIPIQVDFKTKCIKIYLASKETAGWNEIDAVGLRDEAGKVHWATAVEASTTYAQQEARLSPLEDLLIVETSRAAEMERMKALESENRELKKLIAELRSGKQQDSGDAELMRRIYLDLTGKPPTAAEVEAFTKDKAANKRLRMVEKLMNELKTK